MCASYATVKWKTGVFWSGFAFLGETIYNENVPAWVCTRCSEQYYDAPVYKQMEQIARHKERIERMISFPLAEFGMAVPA
jgi:hypothetical protein